MNYTTDNYLMSLLHNTQLKLRSAANLKIVFAQIASNLRNEVTMIEKFAQKILLLLGNLR